MAAEPIKSDVLILGAGPGGVEAATVALAQGLTVTLIEPDRLGGTCLNRGCIPTKALVATANVVETARGAETFGVTVSAPEVNYRAVHARVGKVVDTLVAGLEQVTKAANHVKGTARFVAPKIVEVEDGTRYTADKIIIATGSAPTRLPIPGAELAITSDELLAMDTLPQSMIIIGGGVIGLEFASVLNTLGTQVTVIEFMKEVLPPFDAEIAKRLRQQLTRKGIKFYIGAGAQSITRKDDGTYTVTYKTAKGEASATAQYMLMATGRRPVIPEGCDAAGIEHGRKGIVVDDDMRTTAEGVWAIGDCNCRLMLAHAAEAMARIAMGKEANLKVCPSAVFTSPEAAMVGLTEEQVKATGIPYKVGKSTYAANGKAVAMGAATGTVKMIVNAESGQVLGCSILGEHASDLIAEVAECMNIGDHSASMIAGTIHTHPTLSEVVRAAALACQVPS